MVPHGTCAVECWEVDRPSGVCINLLMRTTIHPWRNFRTVPVGGNSLVEQIFHIDGSGFIGVPLEGGAQNTHRGTPSHVVTEGSDAIGLVNIAVEEQVRRVARVEFVGAHPHLQINGAIVGINQWRDRDFIEEGGLRKGVGHQEKQQHSHNRVANQGEVLHFENDLVNDNGKVGSN